MKQLRKKIIILLLVTLGIGLFMELAFNYKYFLKSPKGEKELSFENAEYGGFAMVGGALTKTKGDAWVLFREPQEYVARLVFTYVNQNRNNMLCKINLYATEQDLANNISTCIPDENDLLVKVSDTGIYRDVYAVRLSFTSENKELTLTSVKYVNVFRFSFRRFLAVFVLAITCGSLFMFRKVFAEKLEYGFLVVASASCLLFVVILPPMKVSWDEAYHLHESYQMGVFGEQVIPHELACYSRDERVWSLLFPDSLLEYRSMYENLNKVPIYEKDMSNLMDGYVEARDLLPAKNVGHIPSAIGIDIARFFHMPLAWVYVMGRLFNAIAYIALVFFALKRAKVGKALLTIVALMPTPLFLASVYSYDAVLNGCVFLGLSIVFGYFADADSKVSWGDFALFVATIGAACLIKMVYAPLFLLLLLLPKDRFENNRTRIIMKYGPFILGVIFVLIMVLPRVLAENAVGDTRGGATNTTQQIRFVISHPVFFVRLLVKSILDTFGSRAMGNDTFATLAHFDYLSFESFAGLPVLAVAVTDMPEKKVFTGWQKLFIGLIVLVNIAIIWTAMYLSFTPVGETVINGVQGRYFVPLVLPMLLLLSTPKIKNEIPRETYNTAVLLIPFLLTFSMVGLRAFTACA